MKYCNYLSGFGGEKELKDCHLKDYELSPGIEVTQRTIKIIILPISGLLTG